VVGVGRELVRREEEKKRTTRRGRKSGIKSRKHGVARGGR